MAEIYIVSRNKKNIVAFSSEEDANDCTDYIEEETGKELFVDSLIFDTFEWEQFEDFS